MTATVSESCCDDDDDNNNNNNNNINSQRTIKNRLSPAHINTGKWVRLLNIIVQEQSVASLGGMQGLKLFLSTIVFSVWWLQRPLVFRASCDRSRRRKKARSDRTGPRRRSAAGPCGAVGESVCKKRLCVQSSLAASLDRLVCVQFMFLSSLLSRFFVC